MNWIIRSLKSLAPAALGAIGFWRARGEAATAQLSAWGQP